MEELYGTGIVSSVAIQEGKNGPFVNVNFEGFQELQGNKLVAKSYKRFRFFGESADVHKMKDELNANQNRRISITFVKSSYPYKGETVVSRIMKTIAKKREIAKLPEEEIVVDKPVFKSATEVQKTKQSAQVDLDKEISESFLNDLILATEIVFQYESAMQTKLDFKFKLSSGAEFFQLVCAIFEKLATHRYFKEAGE